MKALLRYLREKSKKVVNALARLWVRSIHAPIDARMRGPKALRSIKALRSLPNDPVEKIAVLVVHKPSADFKAFMSSLRRRGYKIMGYAYEFDIGAFQPEDAVYVRGMQFGRDFAGYKHAAGVLGERRDVSKVIFANDSFFVGAGIDDLVKWFDECPEDWSGFTGNLREHFHVGSYLFQVRGRALA